jgi:hypothetical protein
MSQAHLTVGSPCTAAETEAAENGEALRAKIIHVLSVYPVISPTMLQIGLGTHVKPTDWRPILTELIKEGIVLEEEQCVATPQDINRFYKKLSLATS